MVTIINDTNATSKKIRRKADILQFLSKKRKEILKTRKLRKVEIKRERLRSLVRTKQKEEKSFPVKITPPVKTVDEILLDLQKSKK